MKFIKFLFVIQVLISSSLFAQGVQKKEPTVEQKSPSGQVSKMPGRRSGNCTCEDFINYMIWYCPGKVVNIIPDETCVSKQICAFYKQSSCPPGVKFLKILSSGRCALTNYATLYLKAPKECNYNCNITDTTCHKNKANGDCEAPLCIAIDGGNQPQGYYQPCHTDRECMNQSQTAWCYNDNPSHKGFKLPPHIPKNICWDCCAASYCDNNTCGWGPGKERRQKAK